MRKILACAFATFLAMVVVERSILAPFALAQDAQPGAIAELQLLDGRVSSFRIEVVDTPETRARGLMFRETLPPDAGMLFIFPDVYPRSFWMRNTLIPLDILFFDEKGRLVRVQADAKPHDETPLPSGAPAQYVLEINGGLAEQLGVGIGTVLRSNVLEPEGLGLGAR